MKESYGHFVRSVIVMGATLLTTHDALAISSEQFSVSPSDLQKCQRAVIA